MGREVNFKPRHYRQTMVHFAAPEPRLRLAYDRTPETSPYRDLDLWRM